MIVTGSSSGIGEATARRFSAICSQPLECVGEDQYSGGGGPVLRKDVAAIERSADEHGVSLGLLGEVAHREVDG